MSSGPVSGIGGPGTATTGSSGANGATTTTSMTQAGPSVQPSQQAIDVMALEKMKAEHAASQLALLSEVLKYIGENPAVKTLLEGVGAKLKIEASLQQDRAKYAHEEKMQAQRLGVWFIGAAAVYVLLLVGGGIALVSTKILTIEVATTLGSCLTTLLLAAGLLRKNKQPPTT